MYEDRGAWREDGVKFDHYPMNARTMEDKVYEGMREMAANGENMVKMTGNPHPKGMGY